MRSRLYILIVVLIVVSGSVWFITSEENDPEITERDFAIKDRSKIDKVVLTKRNGTSIVLEEKEGTWWVNDEREARVNAIDNLLSGLTNVEIKSLPAYSQYETLEKDFVHFSLKVEIFDEEGNLLRSYYVGPDSNSGDGTYYLMENGERFYQMSMPSFSGGMRARFDLEEQDWWKAQIMDFNPTNIKQLIVNYPRQPQSSFVLSRDNNKLIVNPLRDERPKITRPFLEGRAKDYLEEYRRKGILSYANEVNGRDSILNIIPFAEIQVITNKPDTSNFIFIPRTDQDLEGPGSTAQETYFQYTYWLYDPENSDLMTAQHYQYRTIFRGYEYFFAQ